MKISDNCILITGGASGIGRIMGRMALERHARCVVIWDINEKNIEETLLEHNKIGKAKGDVVDVSDNAKVLEAYEKTKAECGEIDILLNCAGIVTSNKTFEHLSYDEIVRTMNINTIAPMLVAKAALPDMLSRNSGHICTIASAAGMISNPKMSVYAASKWGVIGWSDSLRIELHRSRSKVRVTTVAPYYINTGMFDGVTSKIFPILNPENTSRKILNAIERNTDFRGIPWSFHFIRFCQAILPTSWFDFIFGEIFGIYHTMDHFTGRKK
ncbi:MAG: SDR family oxidoreductase [Bacteroidales bacterium]|nr:SDR family oxidoreductase [Bacteroidales bacterium]